MVFCGLQILAPLRKYAPNASRIIGINQKTRKVIRMKLQDRYEPCECTRDENGDELPHLHKRRLDGRVTRSTCKDCGAETVTHWPSDTDFNKFK